MFLVWKGDMPMGSSGDPAILERMDDSLVESTLPDKAIMVLEWVTCFSLNGTLLFMLQIICWFGSIRRIWIPIEIAYAI
ncbi:hypothetical protein BCR42DRAFT_423507 [Absidia repens]|uniref:Uncharacterized protein n=1 Tax=Absidia repens TaxID=90262 RepID=A0A1X2I4U8_9FUNG|nr:hypothetical protein BCR42DRAFT_423507 [Absidia repens]